MSKTNKARLVMLVGIPGCGKTTYADNLEENENFTVYSSDKLREELLSDVNNQNSNELVFKTLAERTKADLTDGKNVCVDATNLKAKNRRHFLRGLKGVDCWKECIVVATPFNICRMKNERRGRTVPEEVMQKMYLNFQTPMLQEGFDEIKIVYPSVFIPSTFLDWCSKHYMTPHDNPHHKLTIGQHCSKALNLMTVEVEDVPYELLVATWLHDIGKPFTKTYEISEERGKRTAHFYNHENVGAYEALFFVNDFIHADLLKVSQYICYHMNPFIWEESSNNKKEKKDKEFWGEQFYQEIKLLHTYDKLAH